MHWYTKEGEPCYEVKKADGKGLRSTTLRDARKLGLVPSVTTIIQVPVKPGFEVWKQNQVLEAVLELGIGLAKKNKDQWKGMILQKSKEVGEKAAKRGNEIHNKLELYFTEGIIDEEDKEFLIPVIERVRSIGELCGRAVSFEPERSFASKEGFGGKIDLSSAKEKIIIDFKTKQDKAFDKELGFDDHVMQLAAYGQGLGFYKDRSPDSYTFIGKYINIFISVETPGKVVIKEWTLQEIQRGWNMFEALKTYWYLVNNL